jgi:uncharacterized protein YndB with AHSA1/START domain
VAPNSNSKIEKGLVAEVAIEINVPVLEVWDALTNPNIIKKYMFGTNVISDWEEGSPIIWKGEWQGKKYEDKGTILKLDANRVLQYTHFSPLSGLPDTLENYHTVTIALSDQGSHTSVSLRQDNNPTEDARGHSEQNWRMMLLSLKKLLENSTSEK